MEKESEINNIDAYHHTEKAKKWMSEKEKEIIHQEIDHKMQELEDTGLTRMEILYNEQKGIPLIDDPVFQYLKNNRIAREMIIKPGEAFTADAVIDKALRQTMEHSLTPNKKYNEQNLINKSENKKTIKVLLLIDFQKIYILIFRKKNMFMEYKTKKRFLINLQAKQYIINQKLIGEWKENMMNLYGKQKR